MTHPRCLNCGDTFGAHSPDPAVHPCEEWNPSTLTQRSAPDRSQR